MAPRTQFAMWKKGKNFQFPAQLILRSLSSAERASWVFRFPLTFLSNDATFLSPFFFLVAFPSQTHDDFLQL